jgi:hypothetical protein
MSRPAPTAAHALVPARPSLRTDRWLKWLVVPAALIVSGLVVAQASYSAYSATTTNPTSN